MEDHYNNFEKFALLIFIWIESFLYWIESKWQKQNWLFKTAIVPVRKNTFLNKYCLIRFLKSKGLILRYSISTFLTLALKKYKSLYIYDIQAKKWPHRDSNADQRNRNPPFYPFNYGAFLKAVTKVVIFFEQKHLCYWINANNKF